MARPTLAAAQSALDNLFDVLTSGNTPVRIQRSGAALDSLGSVSSVIKAAMTGAALTVSNTDDASLAEMFAYPYVDFTVGDTDDADLAAFFGVAGGLGLALGRAARVGDQFEVTGNGDTTDNALDAAKTSNPANGDIYIVDNIGAATESVTYYGNDGELGKALGRPVEVGDVFTVSGNGDTTDNALEAAKLVIESQLPITSIMIPVEFTVTDAQDANLNEFFVTDTPDGELFEILGRTVIVGDEFIVLGAGDTTDNALAAAKLLEATNAQVADILLNDATDATIIVLLGAAGELGLHIGRALVEGDVFEVQANDDTTDNGLDSAKGSNPADGDLFRVLAGDATVAFIGTSSTVAVVANDRFRVTDIGTEAVIFLSNDAEDTTITTALLVTGDIGIALGRAAQVGDKFTTLTDGDTNDNALVAAKGSALTVGGGDIFVVASATEVTFQATLVATVENLDVFEVTVTTIGTEAVAYLGTGTLNIANIKLARGQ